MAPTPGRRFVISGSVTHPERAEIERALAAAEFPSTSQGVRDVLLAFARSLPVRKSVADFWKSWWT